MPSMVEGCLNKMQASYQEAAPVQYTLPLEDETIRVNDLMGEKINLTFSGEIYCTHCGRKIKKSFQQGYCFPCMRKLPETDQCMVRPETCHFDAGTCRDPDWGQAHCFKPHTIYLANSSGVKVGITRQVPVQRWMDQGAVQGLAVLQTKHRLDSGRIEMALKQGVADKTNWRNMLKGVQKPVDLKGVFESLKPLIPGDVDVEYLNEDLVDIEYPVATFPEKIKSLNFDKTPEISGILQGIKGQYLILDSGVLNLKKFTGYKVQFGI